MIMSSIIEDAETRRTDDFSAAVHAGAQSAIHHLKIRSQIHKALQEAGIDTPSFKKDLEERGFLLEFPDDFYDEDILALLRLPSVDAPGTIYVAASIRPKNRPASSDEISHSLIMAVALDADGKPFVKGAYTSALNAVPDIVALKKDSLRWALDPQSRKELKFGEAHDAHDLRQSMVIALAQFMNLGSLKSQPAPVEAVPEAVIPSA
jgi:hypothetical protein